MNSPHGWIVLDKPLGITSAHAVAKVKRLMRAEGLRKPKVGHGGTLDPLATGVLPIALGEATKLTGRMLNGDKSYDFTIRFGTATETDDAEGEVVASSEMRPTLAEVEAVLPRFTGRIRQRPPAYSALKVDGKRAYTLARAGEAVKLEEREVTVTELTLVSPSPSSPRRRGSIQRSVAEESASACSEERMGPPPARRMTAKERNAGSGNKRERPDEITLSAAVSKGTYIRSLARDIAEALGTCGHVSMLRRTHCGPFTLGTAITLDNLEEAVIERGLGSMVLPMTAGLDDIPAFSVTPAEAQRLKHGQHLSGRPEPDGSYLAMDGETPVALVSLISGESRTDRGFNL